MSAWAGAAALVASMATAFATATAAAQHAALPDTFSLATAVEQALRLDPALAAARAAEEAAGHAWDAARAGRLPGLASSADLVRFQEPMVVAPLHGFDIRTPPEFDRTLVQGRVGLEWTVFDGGATGARIRGADAARGAAEARSRATRQERVAEVIEAYLAVLTRRDVVAAADARRRALEAERDRVTRFLAEGTAARVELLRAEAELSAAAAEERSALAAREEAEARLARLLEVSPTAVRTRTLWRAAISPGDTIPAAAAAPEPDVSGHPALEAVRERADAALASASEAAASWWPDVRATGAFQEYGSGAGDFTGEWQAGLRLSWAIFTGGARSAAVDRARAEARSAAEEVRVLERELRTAADRARAAEREATARVAALTDAVEQFVELVRVEELALAEGVGVQSDYLRARAGLFDAEVNLAAARRAVILARASLARAEGRLDPVWVAENTARRDPPTGGSAEPRSTGEPRADSTAPSTRDPRGREERR